MKESNGNVEVPMFDCAAVIPEGHFAVSIEELREQVRRNQVEVGRDGLQSSNRPSDGPVTKIPKGTFHSLS